MARQSATPRPAANTRPRRRFKLAEANKTLPLVKRVVADIVRTHTEVQQLHKRLEEMAGSKEQQSVQTQWERQTDTLQEYVEELTTIGCELKDFSTGLVDFVGRHQGRDVYLCWKLGEEQIEFWHELQAGAAGRQPIATLQEDE